MGKIFLSRKIEPVVPIIGLPLKGYNNTYAVTGLNYSCSLKAVYSLAKYCKETSYSVYNQNNLITLYINSYMNNIAKELLDLCIDGYVEIVCPEKIPDIVLFIIATSEIFLNLFNIKRIDYEEYLHSFSTLDNRFWGIEPSYATCLRCSYLFKELCICRNVYDIVRLSPIYIDARYIGEAKCNRDLCLEIDTPFDNPSTLYILKYTSHVASKISQDIVDKNSISNSTIKHLSLLYSIEDRIVMEAFEDNIAKSIKSLLAKPVPDVSSIKFYDIVLKIDKN